MKMPACSKCLGTGWYAYDHNHSKPCEVCCPHDQGWWRLLEHYGHNNGRWACRRGCGHIVESLPRERFRDHGR
jgi:hypothetical protein